MKNHNFILKTICFSFFLFCSFGCAKTHLTEALALEQDQKSIVEIRETLIKLPAAQGTEGDHSKDMAQESDIIARTLVNQTRETNKEFKMSGGPKWHNFLIHLGVRKKGFCYDWVPELLKALPPQPLKYFERHWGGSFQSMGRENNGIIITKRGAPLKTGIVYDAWRGVGRPFWRYVSQDKYPWEQRFSEVEILNGEAVVEPKR